MKILKCHIWVIVEIILAAVLLALIVRLFSVKAVFSGNIEKPMLAVIIDDFGNNGSGTGEMLSLPIVFTGAVMPGMPCSAKECEALKSGGREYILHQPMEAFHGKISWLGVNPILTSVSDKRAGEIFVNNVKELGCPKGFNNHMGSAVTADRGKMNELMARAADMDMFFVDSLTTDKSAAEEAADEYNVTYIKRDVFLDSTQDVDAISGNLLKAADIAKERGYAVAIGHVGPEGGAATAMAINLTYEKITQAGVEFVPISRIAGLIRQNGGKR